MWKIIRSEFAYLKFKIFPILLAIIGLSIFYGILNVVVLNRLTFILVVFIVARLIGVRKVENRNYKEMIIPLSSNQLALTRLMLSVVPVILINTVAISLNLFLYGYRSTWDDSIFELISLGMITILISFVYFFIYDIFCVFKTKNGKFIFGLIVGTILSFCAIAAIITVEKSFSVSIESGIILLAVILISIILFAVFTIYTNNQRESHIK